jgi:hypothetical protein
MPVSKSRSSALALGCALVLAVACTSRQNLGDSPDGGTDTAAAGRMPTLPVPGLAGTSGHAGAGADGGAAGMSAPPACGADQDLDRHPSAACDGAAGGEIDCDDTHFTVLPGAAEACNGRDDDCDGRSDEQRDCTIAVEVGPSEIWPGFTDLAIDEDGNVFAAGTFSSSIESPSGVQDPRTLSGVPIVSAGFEDIVIASYGPAGELRWVTTFGSAEQELQPDIALHSGRLYVIGALDAPGTIPVAGEDREVQGPFLAELATDDGSLRWLTALETPGLTGLVGVRQVKAIGVAADGEIHAVLSRQLDVGAAASFYYGRFSPEGGVRFWRKAVEEGTELPFGSPLTLPSALAVSPDGRMFIAAYARMPVDIGGCRFPELSTFVLALDRDGACLWQRQAVASEPVVTIEQDFLQLDALAWTSAGRLIAGGGVYAASSLAGAELEAAPSIDASPEADAVVLEIDPDSGDAGWTWQYRSTGSDRVRSLAVDAGSNLYVALALWRGEEVYFEGGTPHPASLAVVSSFDPLGAQRWSRDILIGDTAEERDRESGVAHALAVAPDGSVLTAASGTLTWLRSAGR